MDVVAVRLAGSFGVTRAGAPIFGPGVGSRKARRLLMLLVVNRGQFVGVDRIVDALWGKRPPQEPDRNVATLVSRLRAVLGSQVVVGGRGGYRCGVPPAVRVDVDTATELVNEAGRRLAGGEPAFAMTSAAGALEILGTGALLVGESDADWVATARADAQRLVRDARHTVAAAALLIDDPEAAIRVAAAAVAADRFDEAAHRLLMTAHRTAGEPSKALAVYEELRVTLDNELGVDPAPQTREVHLAVLREHPPTTVLPEPAVRREPVAERRELPGRAAEVAQLRAAWAGAVAGHSSLVLIVGEAGIGKTRLAAEAVAGAESTGGLVLSARCYAAERSLFLQPVVDALAVLTASIRPDRLRELAGAEAAAFAGLLSGAGDVFGSPPMERAAPEVELRRAYEGVTAMLSALGAGPPVLMVLDDLQNVGQATVEFLHYLARRSGSARLLVVATVRAEEGASVIDALGDVAIRIGVGSLPDAAVAQLAAEAGQAEHSEAILRRTGGHALFVTETLRGLAAGESGVPETLRAAVLARLRRAGPTIEKLLHAGAVLGATVDPTVVARLLDVPEHVAAHQCEQAAASRLLVLAGRTYEFANDLVQEVIYTTTPTPTRFAYHRRAADLLSEQPESVAAHAAAVDDWPRAAHAYLLAGQRAADRYATRDAVSLLSRALEAAERAGKLDLVGRVYVARARMRGLLAEYRLAWADARAGLIAAKQSGDRRLEMDALQELGFDTAVALGLPIADVAATIREALAIAESLGDWAAQAVLLARMTFNAINRLQFSEGLTLGRRAAAAGRASGQDQALANGLNGLKAAYAYLGDSAQLTEVIAELQPLQRRLGDLAGLEWSVFESVFPLIAVGRWDKARCRIVEAIEINGRSEYVAARAFYLSHLGWVERLQGRTDEAVRHGRKAVALGEQTNHGWWHPTAVGMLADTLIDAGRHEEAALLLMDARPTVHPGQPEGVLLRYLAPLAEVTGSRSALDEADGLLRGITGPAGSAWLVGTDCYLSVARAWLQKDEPARARTVLAPLLAAAERLAWVPARAGGCLVDGRAAAALGDLGAARVLIGRGVTLAARNGMPTVERDGRAALTAWRL